MEQILLTGIFTLSFFLVILRKQLRAFFQGWKNKKQGKVLKDPKILDLIFKKTGVKLKRIVLLETDRVWGMMRGGFKREMFISNYAYKILNKKELEWLLFHEAGHSKLHHNIKMASIIVLLMFIGSSLVTPTLNKITGFVLSLLLGVSFGVIANQIFRLFEYQANNFALNRMEDPKAITTIFEKVKEYYAKRGYKKDTLVKKLFNVWNLSIYEKLVKDAKINSENKDKKIKLSILSVLKTFILSIVLIFFTYILAFIVIIIDSVVFYHF